MAEATAAVELRGLPPDFSEELLMLYFENRRRSGGGPVASWQRLGRGGVLTFREPADAARVLAREEHVLGPVRLSARPAPPRAPSRVLLQGLPALTASGRLELHVQGLLRAAGLPEQPCRALASPRPDRALVQLPEPLSETEVGVLEEQARSLDLDGAAVTLARVPQARAVRVVGDAPPPDLLLLQLYLENEPRSGGGPLEGLRVLPGALGIVVRFQQWQAAERVLQRDHWLQNLELSLVPHYDVLEPGELAEDTHGLDCLAGQREATERTLPEAGRPAEALDGTETEGPMSLRPEGPPGQEGPMSLRPEGPPGQEGPLRPGSEGLPGQEGPMSPDPVGPLGQKRPLRPGPAGLPGQEGAASPGPVGPLGQKRPLRPGPEGLPGQEGAASPGPAGLPGQQGPVWSSGQGHAMELVLPMEPGALRFLQLYHQDLLASLGDVVLFPLEGTDVTGFRLCGAPAPCQVAEEFLLSLLGSVSGHVLSLRHPGSASFLLGPEGQHLLRGLEAKFQCVFGTERLARSTVHTGPEEVDPTEALQPHTLLAPDGAACDQDNMSLEEVRELLATLEGLDGVEWLPPELGKDRCEEGVPQEEEEAGSPACLEPELAARTEAEPRAPSTRAPGQLEEEAALQLALHRSLGPQGGVAEREEAAALQQALALSLLDRPLLEEEEPLRGGTEGLAQLVVHTVFEQDLEELERALETALEANLWEETVGAQGGELPEELRVQLEWRYGVSIGLCEDGAVLRGFGAQPARAARHLAALLAVPWGQGEAFPLAASGPSLPQASLRDPFGRLECLAESSEEFQEVVRAFYDTLDAAHSRIRIVRVERVSHPLLQQQYELQRERLERRCERQPAEQVLYHGTSAPAVPDICAHGFNRSFCGRNGTLYGQGVYFAKRASLSVQDRYSPPDANGHKAVFVARVLTGDYGQGRRGLRAPPPRACGHHLLRYDSAVDSLTQPRIFVIFHDTQALPTHLITCEHMSRVPSENPSGLSGHSPTS
ncbi:protein mono-ADP-ribosyltransferase PARP10 [Orycteropus afer afer]|uniref:Poly [ADP-ribose] polymerase n=1 Tax=Orycteropus afer afer TaxID=1230840 RepID=A0A8B7B320_ORYAF|nr:protein mono-ADP-ribosyltransferase PARP10 [Orycteropus afer afer]